MVAPTTRAVVDIVHSSPIVAAAMHRALVGAGAHVGLVLCSWAELTRRVDGIGSCVVIDAYLDDHVPLALKVRALVSLPTTAVVLGTRHQDSLDRRSRAEGAAAWLEPSVGLARTARQVRNLASVPSPTPAATKAPGDEVHLTDREMQVMCLYASRRSLNARTLARHLGIAEATVKSHLKEGRAKYACAGRSVGNRQLLGDALAADGYLVSPQTWQAEHRW